MWNITPALNMIEINPAGSQAPEWMELFPAGEIIGRDGKVFVNSAPLNIIQAFVAGGMDLPVDIEHSTELKAPKGEAAPAVGWVRELKVLDGAIWGRVQWNETGRKLVASRQYRYLSPVILYRKGDRSVAALTSVALTNSPNIYLPAINHQLHPSGHAANATVLNATERSICFRMGLTEGEYLEIDPQNDSNGNTSAVDHSLTVGEREICRRMGLSEEDFLNTTI